MRILKLILKVLFAILFISAGILHFTNPDFFVRIVPPLLPAPLFIVYLSGFFEIALGILLLVPKFSRRAAFGLIALLIAVFPANIYMALNPQIFADYNPLALYLRLPIQFVLIAWAFWLTRDKTADN
ncbi:hypothetical protein BH10ACI1_BH10ACI1_34300 [soil metagenome]